MFFFDADGKLSSRFKGGFSAEDLRAAAREVAE